MSLTPQQLQERQELQQEKQKLLERREIFNSPDYVIRGTGDNHPKLIKMRRSIRDGALAQIDADLERIDLELKAYDLAEATGMEYGDARRKLKRKEARRDFLRLYQPTGKTDENNRMLYQRRDIVAAEQGRATPEQLRRLRYEDRRYWEQLPQVKGRASSGSTYIRKAYSSRGESLKEGIYFSGTTGKPVAVRSGGTGINNNAVSRQTPRVYPGSTYIRKAYSSRGESLKEGIYFSGTTGKPVAVRSGGTGINNNAVSRHESARNFIFNATQISSGASPLPGQLGISDYSGPEYRKYNKSTFLSLVKRDPIGAYRVVERRVAQATTLHLPSGRQIIPGSIGRKTMLDAVGIKPILSDEARETMLNVPRAAIDTVRRRPVSTTLTLGAGFFIGRGVSYLAAASKAGSKAAFAGLATTAGAGAFVGGNYVAAVGSELVTAPSWPARGTIIGSEAAKTLPLIAGYSAGFYSSPRSPSSGPFRFRVELTDRKKMVPIATIRGYSPKGYAGIEESGIIYSRSRVMAADSMVGEGEISVSFKGRLGRRLFKRYDADTGELIGFSNRSGSIRFNLGSERMIRSDEVRISIPRIRGKRGELILEPPETIPSPRNRFPTETIRTGRFSFSVPSRPFYVLPVGIGLIPPTTKTVYGVVGGYQQVPTNRDKLSIKPIQDTGIFDVSSTRQRKSLISGLWHQQFTGIAPGLLFGLGSLVGASTLLRFDSSSLTTQKTKTNTEGRLFGPPGFGYSSALSGRGFSGFAGGLLPKAYSPSFYARFYGITSSSPATKFTGLEIRPVIVHKRPVHKRRRAK